MAKEKDKNKKTLLITIILIVLALIIGLIFLFSKSEKESEEKMIVGKWQLVNSSSCDFLDDDLLRINEDKSLEGVSDFNTYEFADSEGIDHLIFSGYGDSKRFEINFNDLNQLEVLEENVSDSLTCTFVKMR